MICQAVDEQLTEMKKTIDDILERLTHNEGDLIQKWSDLTGSLRATESELQSTKQDLAAAQSKLQNTEQEFAAYKETMNDVISSIQGRLDKTEGEFDDTRSRLQATDTKLNDIRQDFTGCCDQKVAE